MNIKISSFDFTDVDLTPPTRDPYDVVYWLCGPPIEIPITVTDECISIDLSTPDPSTYKTLQILTVGSIPDRW